MRIRIRGSAPLTNGSGSGSDSSLQRLKGCKNKKNFPHIFFSLLTNRHIIFSLKKKFFCENLVFKENDPNLEPDPDPYLWLMDPDPDPGGPKTLRIRIPNTSSYCEIRQITSFHWLILVINWNFLETSVLLYQNGEKSIYSFFLNVKKSWVKVKIVRHCQWCVANHKTYCEQVSWSNHPSPHVAYFSYAFIAVSLCGIFWSSSSRIK